MTLDHPHFVSQSCYGCRPRTLDFGFHPKMASSFPLWPLNFKPLQTVDLILFCISALKLHCQVQFSPNKPIGHRGGVGLCAYSGKSSNMLCNLKLSKTCDIPIKEYDDYDLKMCFLFANVYIYSHIQWEVLKHHSQQTYIVFLVLATHLNSILLPWGNSRSLGTTPQDLSPYEGGGSISGSFTLFSQSDCCRCRAQSGFDLCWPSASSLKFAIWQEAEELENWTSLKEWVVVKIIVILFPGCILLLLTTMFWCTWICKAVWFQIRCHFRLGGQDAALFHISAAGHINLRRLGSRLYRGKENVQENQSQAGSCKYPWWTGWEIWWKLEKMFQTAASAQHQYYLSML